MEIAVYRGVGGGPVIERLKGLRGAVADDLGRCLGREVVPQGPVREQGSGYKKKKVVELIGIWT